MTSFARFGPRLRLILLVAMTFAALLLAPYLGGESVDPLGGARDLIAGRDSQAGRILTLETAERRVIVGAPDPR